MAKKGKKKPPSRVKYEEANPTVSCRVSLEAYARIKSLKEAENTSFAEFLLAGAGIIADRRAYEAKLKKAAFDKGEQKGFDRAESLYKVSYLCAVCLKLIDVTMAEEKAVAAQALQRGGWGHGSCHQKKQGI